MNVNIHYTSSLSIPERPFDFERHRIFFLLPQLRPFFYLRLSIRFRTPVNKKHTNFRDCCCIQLSTSYCCVFSVSNMSTISPPLTPFPKRFLISYFSVICPSMSALIFPENHHRSSIKNRIFLPIYTVIVLQESIVWKHRSSARTGLAPHWSRAQYDVICDLHRLVGSYDNEIKPGATDAWVSLHFRPKQRENKI